MGKGKTVRQIHHFTDGLWSPDMDARADLQASVNSCRKLTNFQIDQYGEVIRRPGLQHVSSALGECLAIDPSNSFPEWESLTDSESITSVDQYGSLGFEEVRQISHAADWWILCDWLVYCDGPAVEGVGMQGYRDRYTTRWRAKLEDGIFYYGKVGEPFVRASTDLYPSALLDANGLGFCFDVDGLPVFATQRGSDIEIRRFVAETPTTFTFNGTGPKLYLNAEIQWQNTLWDVVCYYCYSGDLQERFERDNFNTAYTLYHSVDNYLTRVKNVDTAPDNFHRVYLAATGSLNFRGMFRTGVYPLWPEYDQTAATIALRGDGAYDLVVIDSQSQDSTTASISINSDGAYDPAVIQKNELDSTTATIGVGSDGDYIIGAIDGGSYTEYPVATISLGSDGDYVIGAIDGGSYTEPSTATISIRTDGDYSL